jgi:hypothetical protein
MLGLQDLIAEWVETRERIAAHLLALGEPPRLHLVDDPAAAALIASVETLRRWQSELDETVVGLLMRANGTLDG